MAGENLNEHPENMRLASSEGIRRQVMTMDEIIQNALVDLGAPIVDVELADGVSDVLWSRTLDMYNRYMPITKHDLLDGVASSVNRYDMRKLNKPYGRGIINVSILTKENFFSPISGVFALGIPHPISHLSPDQYDLALRYIKTARKVYSSQPDWHWEEPIVHLYAPTGFGGPFIAAYMYNCEANDPADIPDEDRTWIKEYFSAMAKLTIGRARRKFGGLPGPMGQSLDGAELVAEGKEEKAKLEQDLEIRSYALTPPLGPGGNY